MSTEDAKDWIMGHSADGLKGRKIAVAYGGGSNSTALLFRFYELGIIPDLILFADTGGERPEVYANIEAMNKWLPEHGMPPIIVVKKGGMQETLEENCLRKGMLPSIAYGFKSCSEKYKIRAQEKFCNNWDEFIEVWKRGEKVVKVIGYDAGEERRAKISENDKYDYWYPLIQWGWFREECVDIIERYGFKPMKSSCFFCPSMTKKEIIALRDNHPDLLERALKIEDTAMANLNTVKGLGRRFNWREFLESVKDGGEVKDSYADHNETPCGCYDGE